MAYQKRCCTLASVSERTVYRWVNGETKVPKLLLKELEVLYNKTNNATLENKYRFIFIGFFAGTGGLRKNLIH